MFRSLWPHQRNLPQGTRVNFGKTLHLLDFCYESDIFSKISVGTEATLLFDRLMDDVVGILMVFFLNAQQVARWRHRGYLHNDSKS